MPLGSVVTRVGLRPRLSGRGGGRSRPGRGCRSELSRAGASAEESSRAAAGSNPHSCSDGAGLGEAASLGGAGRGEEPLTLRRTRVEERSRGSSIPESIIRRRAAALGGA